MSINPWMKFYPTDWRGDAALRSVSFAARGLWMDMLSLMHEAEPYGHLLVNGRAPLADRLARMLGGVLEEVTQLLDELEEQGVFSRTDDGTIYSRRMVRDHAKAARDKANGGTGGNPNIKRNGSGGVNPPLNPMANLGDNGGDKAQKLEARIQSQKEGRGSPAGNSRTPARATPRRTLPEGWEPNDTSIALAFAIGINLNEVQTEADKMRDWARHRGETGANWDARFNNWLRKEASDRQHRRRHTDKRTVQDLQKEWNLPSFLTPNFADDEPPLPAGFLLS